MGVVEVGGARLSAGVFSMLAFSIVRDHFESASGPFYL